ncbi:MAG: hypothetical protein QOF77_2078 [Solirubrobacteraceae bacterium]|jgi:hypothetical protein|nr:hypothetical protein [Solirubrobacteraceae bacterium]
MPDTPDLWPAADLTRRVGGALDTAARAVAALADHGYVDRDHPHEPLRPEKVVAETGLLLLAAAGARGRSGAVRERFDAVVAQLLPHARGERVAAALCLAPTRARDHALAHCCLSRLGYPDPAFDRLFAASLDACHPGGPERLPHRQLEQDWLARLWDPRHRPSAAGGAAAGLSVLNAPLDILGLDRDAVYALTHAVMYITDLGARRPALPRPAALIEADADAALAFCLDTEDYDLAGEVLLTWPLLRRRWSPLAVFTFGVLASLEDRAGFLPGLSLDIDRFHQLEGAERTTYALASSYHTAFVMGLLCACCLRPGARPPVAVPALATGDGGPAPTLLAGAVAGSEDRHWVAYYRRLSPAQRASIASLPLTIAIRRAAAVPDLGATRDALIAATRLGLTDAPAARQAGDLLQRAMLLEDARAGVVGYAAQASVAS